MLSCRQDKRMGKIYIQEKRKTELCHESLLLWTHQLSVLLLEQQEGVTFTQPSSIHLPSSLNDSLYHWSLTPRVPLVHCHSKYSEQSIVQGLGKSTSLQIYFNYLIQRLLITKPHFLCLLLQRNHLWISVSCLNNFHCKA